MRALLLFLTLLAIAGCDIHRVVTSQTSGLLQRAIPAYEQHWDYDLAGDAAPANILQLEGILRSAPEDQSLLLQLARAYSGYAYGWIEDQMEEAIAQNNMERADHLQWRARYMYMRARDLGKRLIDLHSDGLDKAVSHGLDTFKLWIAHNFPNEESAPILLITGQAWGQMIGVSRDDPALIADLPFAQALVRHSVKLSPKLEHAAGLMFLGYVTSEFPESLGGDPEEGRQYFERALELTHQKALLVHVNYAKSYAVMKQDRTLYESLLRNVSTSPDLGSDTRLVNQIARRRARRYLKQTDLYFP